MGLRIRWTALLAVLVLLTGCSLPGQARATPAPATAPSFTLIGLDGRQHSLGQYRGHIVLINFWATWCIPCRAEIPELETAYKKYQARGVVFLGIDWKESQGDVRAFADERQVTYPILLDTDGKAYTAYQVPALPQTYVLDKQGRVVITRTGIATRDKFDAELKSVGA
jgi:peroxiredoxin